MSEDARMTVGEYLSLVFQSRIGKKLVGERPEVIDLVFERFNATVQPDLDHPPAVVPTDRLTYEEWDASEWGQWVREETK